jgi:hypothetical protein
MPNEDAPPNAPEYYQISLHGEEGDYPSLIDISSFLYDFNLLYEFSRLIVDPRYGDYRFSRYSGYRNARRIYPGDRLLVESLLVESPIALTVAVVLTVPSAAAIWALTQAFERIANFRINRDILRIQRDTAGIQRDILELQRDNLRRASASADASALLRLPETDQAFREQTRIREADYYFGRVEEHLRRGPVHIKEAEITAIRELPAKHNSSGDVRS